MASVQQTLNHLRQLKLSGMADAYALQTDQPSMAEMAFDDRMAMLVDSEVSSRDNKRLKRLVRSAGLAEDAVLEDIDWHGGRGLDKALINSLSSCNWVARHQHVTLVGASGAGKTWLACALGTQACRMGLSVLYRRMSDLAEEIAGASIDGTLPALKLVLARKAVLIIDDFGLGDISKAVANTLLDIIELRRGTGSLVIASQYPVKKWYALIPDPTLADAILDRVIHAAHLIQLEGESQRKRLAKKRMAENAA